MSDAPLEHGVFVPQGWKLEYTGWSAADAWARSVELAQAAEETGYDHIWVYDHVETVPRREPTHVFEAFTMLAALSQRTSRVRLGQLVTCAAYRNAGLLAKEAASLDVYSGGRLILGLGAGWFEREYQAYGWEFPSAGTRLAILDETLQVMRRLWSEETVTFDGDARAPRRRLLRSQAHPVAAADPGRAAAARRSRCASRPATPTRSTGRSASTRSCASPRCWRSTATRSVARSPTSCGPTAPTAASSTPTPRPGPGATQPGGGSLSGRDPIDDYLRDNLVGTVEQVVEKAQGYVDAGCRQFILWLRDYPSDETLRRWITEVAPKLSV